ncbi:MAG: DUF4249 domain-containing protein [Bacteroidota bacterium]
MLSFKYVFYAILISLITSSCQRLVDIDLSGESQLVVSCFISPDQKEVQLKLSQNQTVGSSGGLDASDFIVPDAIVKIENLQKGQEIELTFDTEHSLYSTIPPLGFLSPSDSFTLSIQHPDFPAVSGQCQIPAAPQQFAIQLDSVTADGDPFPDFFCQTSWEDPAQERNYYRVIGKIIPSMQFFVNSDPWFFRWQGLSVDPDYLLDDNFDGQAVVGPTGDLQNVARNLNGVRPPRMPGDSLVVALLHVDENYYRYMRDLRQNRNVDLAFSEPYTIFSNLEGGIGIFAAYHADEKRLQIR